MLCRIATRATIFAVALILHGCIIPAVKVSSDREIPFGDFKLEGLLAGLSSKADALNILGAPGIEFSSGSIWMYEEVHHQEWFYSCIFGDALGGCAEGGRYEKDIPHFLILRFDTAGVLESRKVLAVRDEYAPLFDKYAQKTIQCNEVVCASWLLTRDEDGTSMYEYRGTYSMFATQADDAQAKQFELPGNRCGVYLYWNRNYPVETWVDGQPAGWLLDNSQFFFWQLDPGQHHLFVRAVKPLSRQILDRDALEDHSVRIDCAADNLYFFEPESWMGLRQRDIAIADEAIGKRRLVLSTWDKSRNARPFVLTPDMELRIIDVGVTTREDLISRYGQPDVESTRHGLMAYIKEGSEWFDMIGAENGMQMLGQRYLLFVRIESDGGVAEYELRIVNSILDSSVAYKTSSERVNGYEHIDGNLNCTSDGFCVAPGDIFAHYAVAGKNEAARGQLSLADKSECVLNVFNERTNASFGEHRYSSWRLTLSGKTAGFIHDSVWPWGFHQWRLPPGEYEITAEALGDPVRLESMPIDKSGNPLLAERTITCKRRNEYYFSVKLERWGASLDLIEDDIGKTKLRYRNLILSEL